MKNRRTDFWKRAVVETIKQGASSGCITFGSAAASMRRLGLPFDTTLRVLLGATPRRFHTTGALAESLVLFRPHEKNHGAVRLEQNELDYDPSYPVTTGIWVLDRKIA